ncbi:MAG: hypothetical protein EPN97_03090 [Alphaproteobacteria bacterium]|nr:MAG: hypothetical protein EPN97_03090 [Alphaproteobacteria bacterium]
MTIEPKGKIVRPFFRGILIVAYYAGCVFWMSAPFWLTAFVIPETTGFLKNIGKMLPLRTRLLIDYSYICGIICMIINVGYPIWHFFIKRQRTDVFKNKLFSWWVFSANFALLLWLASAVFAPVYSGGHPKY